MRLSKRGFTRLIRYGLKPILSPFVPFKLRRLLLQSARWMQSKPKDVSRRQVKLGEIRTYHVTALSPDHLTILYLHGGGYVFGGLYTHQALVDEIAHTGNCSVYMPDYRLAPEHPFPAALDDALASYQALLKQGIDASSIVFAGDSAGGGLALALALHCKELALPQPRALVLFSPWVDLTLSLPSYQHRRNRDPMLSPSGLESCAQAYCATTDPSYPLCSPLFADLEELPPIIIQVGSEEILYDDAIALHDRALNAGVTSELTVFPQLWHDFQLQVNKLPEANQAIISIFAHPAIKQPL